MYKEHFTKFILEVKDIIAKVSIVVMGEAEGCSFEEKKWIAHTVLNRLKYPASYFDKDGYKDEDGIADLDDVIVQFYGYNRKWDISGKLDRQALIDSITATIEAVVDDMFDIDPTNGATFFATKSYLDERFKEGKSLADIFTKYHKLQAVFTPNNFKHAFFRIVG